MSTAGSPQLDLFLGILKAVRKSTGHRVPPHLTALLDAHGAPEPGDIPDALETAARELTAEQKAVLFANLLNLCVKDGRPTDRKLIQTARETLRVDRSDANDLQDSIEARSQTDYIFRKDEEWAVFCAGLTGMAQADEAEAHLEFEYLADTVAEAKHIEAGKKLLENDPNKLENGLDRFSTKQKQCFTAHAMAMMFVDGDYKASEQATLEYLTEHMRLADYQQERLMKGMYTLFNLGVFA